jgi:hypothetical protein
MPWKRGTPYTSRIEFSIPHEVDVHRVDVTELEMVKQTLFVIFASPQTQVAAGTCYIAPDASTTLLSSKAAKFYTLAEAKAFAAANHIALNGHTYIGLKDFIVPN